MVEIARHYKQGPVKRKDIAREQDLSHAYLENILIALKANKLIRTTRGANGGFVLETEPSKISLYTIVTTLEGSIAPVECLEREAACEKTGRCVARKAWQKLYDAQVEVLRSISLQDLLDMETDAAEIMYTI
jgi:Rrf2 family protein